MKFNRFSEKSWYNGAVVACIGVAFYVLLTNLPTVFSSVRRFVGNFSPVILGVVLAYMINPLAKFFYYRLFRKMKVGQKRWSISVVLAFLVALLVVIILVLTLIPQLVGSVAMLSENFDSYAKALISLIHSSGLDELIDMGQIETLSQNAMSTISSFLKKNAGTILNTAANSGKNIASFVISLILSIYLLLDKTRVMIGVRRLVSALFKRETTLAIMDFALRCDSILVSFIVQSLLDALIIGGINAVFMLVCRMEYVGLISLVVAATNLIPNFGAAIGAVSGGFILLLVNPMHALMFIVFSILLQSADAYIIKPKLFANSLGVSGLLILVASIVLGNMFGIIGILLAIPAAAILSFIYHDYFLPAQEKRRQKT